MIKGQIATDLADLQLQLFQVSLQGILANQARHPFGGIRLLTGQTIFFKMDGLDEILIENLRVQCVIGAYDSERVIFQPLLFSLRIKTNFRECAQSDQLDQCYVDYA